MRKTLLILSIVLLGFGLFSQSASACSPVCPGCYCDFIPGCTDPEATNYNPEANVDDGTCQYDVLGCTDPEALNYNPEATIDDGSCEYPIEEVEGCTDPEALNYNSEATVDDGSCEYPEDSELYSIFGRKFNDENNNGVDDSEPGLENWTITITDGDQFIDSTITDSEGNYSFSELSPGTYTVCEEMQEDWIQTYPAQGCYIVELEEQTQYSNSCPLLTKTGRIIVEFQNARLYSDREESASKATSDSIFIQAGTYDISFVSYDAHSEHPMQDQQQESWHLTFGQQSTSSTPDLPDENDWLLGLLEDDFVVLEDITSITANHSAYKTPGNPNSIEPRCVAFDSKLTGFDFGNHYQEPVVEGCTDPEALNYNPEDTIDDGSCEYPEPEALTIKAYKVVCENEEDLPNWTDGGAPSIITENTASNYVSESCGACWIEADWDFQWGYSNVPKLDGDYIGKALPETGWKDFDSSTSLINPAMVQIEDLQSTSKIWVREVLKEGYIPFTNPPKEVTEDNVSAEIYCHTDILNYDNYDYIISPEAGETYYCIAFNSPIEEEVEGCTDPEALNYNPEATVDDGSCEYPIEEVEGCTDTTALNYNPEATIDDGSCEYPLPPPPLPPGGSVRPRFSINKSVDKEIANPEDILTYTILVECLGSGIARDTILTDELPEGFSYTEEDEDGEWDLGDMMRGDKKTFTYEVLVSEDSEEGKYSNTATVKATNSDEFKDTAEVEITGVIVKGEEAIPELVVKKTANKSNTTSGSYLLYEIEVKNNGEAPAINLTVNDTLPEGFIAQDGSSFVSWEIPMLLDGDSWTKQFSVYVGTNVEIGSYDNVVTVLADNHDQIEDVHTVGIGVLPNTAGSFWNKLGHILSRWADRRAAEISAAPSPRSTIKNLSIPSIGVKIPIIEASTEKALERGAWLLPQTSTPDKLKNTVLAAHRYKYRPPHKETFYLLDKVQKGDKLFVAWNGEDYEYTVTSIFVAPPTFVEVLKETKKPTLTLITCHPLFSDKERLIVQGEIL